MHQLARNRFLRATIFHVIVMWSAASNAGKCFTAGLTSDAAMRMPATTFGVLLCLLAWLSCTAGQLLTRCVMGHPQSTFTL